MRKCLQLSLLAVLSLCFAKPAAAQGSLANFIVWRYTPAGAFPASGATVTICTASATGTPCSPTVTVYQDSALSIPVANPLAACTTSPQIGCLDGLGNATFYATPGNYTYSVTGAGLNPYSVPFGLPCVVGVSCVASNANVNFTGTINCTIINAVRCISPSNPQGWAGSDPGAWINSAVSGCGSSLPPCAIDIAPGTYAIATQINPANPVRIRGSGWQQTILQPTAALVGALINANISLAEGFSFEDFSINMANVPANDAMDMTQLIRPLIQNIKIFYPSGATGIGINVLGGGGEIHAIDVYMKFPGICVQDNGDNVQEDFWFRIVCESPNGPGYKLVRTTSTDTGAQYLVQFKITNPSNLSTTQGFMLTSTQANTANPLWCMGCVADNIQGGHSFSSNNISQVYIEDDSWFTNTAAAGSNFSAISFTGTSNHSHVWGGHLLSNSRDFAVNGTISAMQMVNNYFDGSAVNVFLTGSTLQTFELIKPLCNVNNCGMTAANQTLLNAAGPGNGVSPMSGGLEVWVNNAGGTAQTFRLVNKTSGGSLTSKSFRIGNSGDLQILNDAGSAIMLDVPDAAQATVPSNTGTVAETNLAQSWTAAQTIGAGGSLNFTSLLASPTAPTITGAGCGGTVAAIQNANGTASFEIFTGTAPTSAGCTVTFPAAAHHWICPTITHTSAVSTTNFIILQTGALSSTSVTFQLFSDVAAATAPTASDTWAVSGCHAN